MGRIKMNIPVGQKIRGYGVLNEYGEFDFIPEQKGAREGQINLLKQGDDYSVSTTKKLVIVHLRLERKSGLALLKDYLSKVNEVMNVLKNYEF